MQEGPLEKCIELREDFLTSTDMEKSYFVFVNEKSSDKTIIISNVSLVKKIVNVLL